MDLGKITVCIIGLGYVGFPLAEAFSKHLRVIGFDIDQEKLYKLNNENRNTGIVFTNESDAINEADFIVICVPTPVTESKEPDLSHIKGAAKIIGQNMKKGCVVILESTVYPGVTEEVLKPILETETGMKCGYDFKIAYSPERINPGDTEHTIDKITKIVAGIDEETTEMVAELYGTVTPNIFRASSIRTAEAAKVIENIQRDINIALMNELALIFDKLGLDTNDVLNAAATKWNFHRYSPGLVGGHCIPVDPYYLVYKAKEVGYNPQVIIAGRAINNSMASHVVELTIKALHSASKALKGAKILIMGLTYKENVADTRETPVKAIINGLKEHGLDVYGHDPHINNIEDEFGIQAVKDFKQTAKVDCIIIAVAHSAFQEITLTQIKSNMKTSPILIDIKTMFNRQDASDVGIFYRSL